MKKLGIGILCLLLMIGAFSHTAAASEYLFEGDFLYAVYDGKATLIRYDGTDTDVTVPPTLGGCPVTVIKMYAFSSIPIERVTLPDGVERIGQSAFSDAEHLREIVLPDTLKQIEGSAFLNCRSLERVDLPSGLVQIGSSAFGFCEALRGITLPDSLTSLGDNAFYGCASLERVYLPDSLNTLPMSCFAECVSLREVRLPQTLTVLPQMSFGNCASLEEIALPATLEQISTNVFYRCGNLRSLTVPARVSRIDGGFLAGCGKVDLRLEADGGRFCIKNNCLYDGTRLVQALYGAQMPTEGVTEVCAYAFCGADWLEEAVIPDGVNALGYHAFSDCVSLRSVSVPSTVDTMQINAFSGCTSLTEVHLAEGITRIGGWAFADCTALKQIELPNSTEIIDYGAFSGSGLTSIFLPYWVQYLYANIFENCASLTRIECEAESASEHWLDGWNIGGVETVFGATREYAHGPAARFENDFGYRVQDGRAVLKSYLGKEETLVFPATLGGLPVAEIPEQFLIGNNTVRHLILSEGIQTVGMMAFGSCENLQTVVLPQSLMSLGGYAFSDCTALREINLPSGVTALAHGIFSGCTSLTELTLPDGVQTIPEGMFAFCGLTEVHIPDSVSEIGDGAFSACPDLHTVHLSEGVQTVGNRAFSDCENLREVHLPTSLRTLGDCAFVNCPQLERVTVGEGNPVFRAEKTALLSEDTLLLFWGEGELPAGIKTIGKGACSARGMTSVTIPDGVQTIDAEAFYLCDKLTSVTFPDSLKVIENGAFGSCSSLQKVIFPMRLERIGSMTFAWCDALCEVYLPESLEVVEEYAFFHCGSLQKVFCGADKRPDGWSYHMFRECGADGTPKLVCGVPHPEAKVPGVSDESVSVSESVDVSHEEPKDGVSPAVWVVIGVLVIAAGAAGVCLYFRKKK